MGRIALHFHPERLSASGRNVAEGLLRDGVYKNQFETGLSSGSPTAFPGGARDDWEKQFFGGGYHLPGMSVNSRPKYGALITVGHPDGPAPRFGSCYFVLHPAVTRRSSFTFGGSQDDLLLQRTGTLETIAVVLAVLLQEIEEGAGALGISGLNISTFFQRLARVHAHPLCAFPDRTLGRSLDSFVEAQIHGSISLERDVERLVADPSFKRTEIGSVLHGLCERYGIELAWHPGYQLPLERVPEFFRGYRIDALAKRIAGDGYLTAANIGAAANDYTRSPDAWPEVTPREEALTYFRRIWHALVLHAEPIE